jgi:hypothetical protein
VQQNTCSRCWSLVGRHAHTSGTAGGPFWRVHNARAATVLRCGRTRVPLRTQPHTAARGCVSVWASGRGERARAPQCALCRVRASARRCGGGRLCPECDNELVVAIGDVHMECLTEFDRPPRYAAARHLHSLLCGTCGPIKRSDGLWGDHNACDERLLATRNDAELRLSAAAVRQRPDGLHSVCSASRSVQRRQSRVTRPCRRLAAGRPAAFESGTTCMPRVPDARQFWLEVLRVGERPRGRS